MSCFAAFFTLSPLTFKNLSTHSLLQNFSCKKGFVFHEKFEALFMKTYADIKRTCLKVSGDCFLTKRRTASTFSYFFIIFLMKISKISLLCFKRTKKQRMMMKKEKKIGFFGRERSWDNDCICVFVPRASSCRKKKTLYLSLSLYMERKTESVCVLCLKTASAKKLMLERSYWLVDDAVMSFCGR